MGSDVELLAREGIGWPGREEKCTECRLKDEEDDLGNDREGEEEEEEWA